MNEWRYARNSEGQFENVGATGWFACVPTLLNGKRKSGDRH